MMDCKQKMAKMLAAGKGGDGSRLPACIMEGIESEYIKDIESKLTAHLLMYGIGSPKRSNEEASSLIHASVATNSPSRKHQSQGLSALSETSVTSGSNSTYESTGSSAFFSDDEDGNRGVNQRQIETPRNKFTNLKVHYQSPTANTDSEKSFRDDDQEDVRRIPKNHSFPNHQFAYPRDQVQAYVGSKSVADDSSEISSIHSINSWSVNADESHYLRSSRYSASNNKSQPTIARPQFTSPPTYQQPSTNDQPMRMSDINYQQQQQHIGRIQREHSNYSSSPQPILQQQQHNSLEEYPKTLWQTSQVHPHRSQSPDFKLQARASSPNSPHDGHVSRSSSPRWNVSTRAESRSSSPSALSGSQSKALTGEDLKLRQVQSIGILRCIPSLIFKFVVLI